MIYSTTYSLHDQLMDGLPIGLSVCPSAYFISHAAVLHAPTPPTSIVLAAIIVFPRLHVQPHAIIQLGAARVVLVAALVG